MNSQTYILALLPFLIVTFVMVFPEAILNILLDLLRQIRLSLVNWYGRKQAKTIFNELRKQAAKNGTRPEVVEQIIQENKARIIWVQGNAAVNKFLGKPHPLIECDFQLPLPDQHA